MFDDAFDDIFAVDYEDFLINNEPEYDVFELMNCVMLLIAWSLLPLGLIPLLLLLN